MSAIGSVQIPLALPGGGGTDPGGPVGGGPVGGGPKPPCPDKDKKTDNDRDSRADKLRKRMNQENSGANTTRNACNFDSNPNTKWVPAHIDGGQLISGACQLKK